MIKKINTAMREHTIDIRVRYSETDQMGMVYYGNYAQYFEIGRVEWLRNIGVIYKKMEEIGIVLPVLTLNVVFKKPVSYDQLIKVTTRLKSRPSRKIVFDYEITNDKGELLTTAITTLLFVSKATMKPLQCPSYILDKIVDIRF